MGKVVFSMIVTLDGFIEDREGSIGFTTPSDDLHRYFNDSARETGVHLLGRRIYGMMEPYWPDLAANPSGEEISDDFARVWVETPRIVFSTTLEEVGPGCELRREIDPDEIRRLRNEHDMVNVAGPDLASNLAALGLIDEVELAIAPMVLGGGKPMFGPGFDGARLEPAGSTSFDSGELVLRYRVAQ